MTAIAQAQLEDELRRAQLTVAAEYAAEQKLIREGRTLTSHKLNPGAHPSEYGAGQLGTTAGRQRRAVGEKEADSLGLKGVIKRLFLREREEGWIEGGQFENVTEQGFLDALITPLSLGLVHGPGAGRTNTQVNPKTGKLHVDNEPGVGEQTQKAAHQALGWGEALGKLLSKLLDPAFMVRVLKIVAGGVIVLVALYLLARAIAPDATPSASGIAGAIATPGRAAGKLAGRTLAGAAERKRKRTTSVSPRQKARQAQREKARVRPRTSSTSSTSSTGGSS